MCCHIPETIINMSTLKDDKNKKLIRPLAITKQSPKKAKLGSPDVIFTTTITHVNFGDHNVIQMFWALKNTKCV